MPLQIRRGTDAERLLLGPSNGLVVGEILYVTDTQRLYIGTGLTGDHQGTAITGYTNEDAQDAVAPMFTGGSHSGISFTYNDSAGTINATVDFSSFTGPVVADSLKGSVFADDSTLIVDAIDHKFYGDLTGNVIGNVVGNVTGYHFGDTTGSVFADNSAIMVDAVSNRIVASSASFSGSLDADTITAASDIRTNQISPLDFTDILLDADVRTSGQFIGTLNASVLTGIGDISIQPEGTVYIGSGSSSIDGSLYIVSNTYTSAALAGFTYAQHHATSDAINFNFYRSRGTSVAPTAVADGDDIIDIGFWGHDGSTVLPTASITVTVEGTPTTGHVPSRIRLATDNGSTIVTRAQLTSFGVWECDTLKAITASTPITLSSIPVLPTFASESAANTSVGSSPVNGMMYYDSGANAIKGYVNGSWVALS